MTRLTAAIVVSLLAGCTEAPEHDLRTWMSEVRRQSHPVPGELPRRPRIQEFQYEAGGRLDPFDMGKIAAATSPDPNASGLQPDTRRTAEPLESFPLDNLRLVGSLRRRGQVVALVEADKVIHQVQIGSHLGPDMGKVIAIDEGAIELEEMVQDAGNRWSRRRVRLVMQEKR
jgi:type IV pilus assembly protein PilP